MHSQQKAELNIICLSKKTTQSISQQLQEKKNMYIQQLKNTLKTPKTNQSRN